MSSNCCCAQAQPQAQSYDEFELLLELRRIV